MNKIVPPINDPEKTGRRDFLKNTWKILGLVAAAELGFLTINLLKTGKEKQKGKEGSTLKVAGNVEDFQINSVTTDRINKLFLIRRDDGGFLALSLTCTHLGCSVIWEEAKNRFICPCHSSAFDKSGNVINSPAPRALDYYPILIEAGKVKIDVSQKLQRRRFEKNQVTYAN
jgi:cytochrome b6-f complex iron-sulfur subunit